MSTIVLGAGGLLGRHLARELGGAVTAYDHTACDIATLDEVCERTRGAQLILNCAAFTNVDAAEADEAGAYRANALGAENVARAAALHGARLVHVSTDFVFDGAKRDPHDEFDTPRPQSRYARSKWAGEELVRRVGGRVFIVRVQALYGTGGTSFASRLRQLVLEGRQLRLDCERRVQPTWAAVAARQILALAKTDHFGLYHVSCRGETTWAGFARRLAERLGAPPRWQEVPTSALAAAAARPANCLFHNRMLSLRGFPDMPEWTAAQDDYLAEAAAAAESASEVAPGAARGASGVRSA